LDSVDAPDFPNRLMKKLFKHSFASLGQKLRVEDDPAKEKIF